MAPRDWVEWHRDYDDPGSLLSRRGELVQGHLRAELDRAPAGRRRDHQAFDVSHDGFMSVGAHRLAGKPAALTPGQRLFTFPGGT